MPTTQIPIDYIEFTVTDMVAAKRFYTAAFGWAFNDYGPGYAGIQSASSDDEVGGFALADQANTGGPLVVLHAEQLEGVRTKVVEAGGTVVKDIFDFPGGRRFEFTDPSGNRLAVWSKG